MYVFVCLFFKQELLESYLIDFNSLESKIDLTRNQIQNAEELVGSPVFVLLCAPEICPVCAILLSLSPSLLAFLVSLLFLLHFVRWILFSTGISTT
jgi:hypothetical protein